jgi:predicted permease
MRFYDLLLRLYPASFRSEYGSELRSLHARRRGEASFGPAFWLREIADTAWNAGCVQLDVLRQDLRFAARSLRRDTGFAATATLVTALGIGANAAVFSVTDRVLVRPLPYRDPARLVALWENVPGYQMELSPPNFEDWRRMATSFESMGAYFGQATNLVGIGEPQRVEAVSVSGELLPLLGVEPHLGRLLVAHDTRPEAPEVVVISYALWRREFGGAADVVGRSLRLDDGTATVIGVLPASFSFPDRTTRLWRPLRVQPDDAADRDNNFFKAVARLRPGVSVEAARAEMDVITAQLEREHPKENEKTRAYVIPLREQVSRQSRLLLLALCGASACVLIIACANLASLLLARALRRRSEIGMRAALGAGRERLVRQLLTESLLLALAGGVLGVLLATASGPLLARLVPPSLPVADLGVIDLRVLAFAAIVSTLTGLAFGVLPSLRAASADANAWRQSPRAGLGGVRERLRSTLVLAEIATAVVLLVASGLLIRSLLRVRDVDPGFRSEGVLTLRTALPQPRYAPVAERERLYATVLDEVRRLPGVSGAAYISFLPMAMRGGIWPIQVGGLQADRREGQTASLRFVTPGFFATLGIPLLRGRDVGPQDTQDAPYVAVVSASFAERYWPGEDPLGRRFGMAFFERSVVGVVGDVRVRGLERESEPQVYLPHRQVRDDSLAFYVPKDLVIRATADPESLLPAVRRIVQTADPEVPISDVQTLQAVVDADSGPRLAQARVLAVFGALALGLAGLGIYGLLAYAVSQRVPEIGVRLALGASAASVLRLVVGDGARLLAAGGLVGLGLAYAAGRSLEALLFGVTPTDAPVFAAALGLVAAAALAGSLVPALRAVRIDPVRALRAD